MVEILSVGMCSKVVQFSTNIFSKFIMIEFLVRFFFPFEQKRSINIVQVLFFSNIVHLLVCFNFFQM